MLRLIFFGLILLVSLLIWVAKQAVGQLNDDQELTNTTMKGQTQRTMDSAARGLNWLEKQWEQAKEDAEREKGIASREFKDYDKK